MKHLRVTARPDRERAPAFFLALADSPHVAEGRAIDWNLSAEGAGTLLYAVDGDPEPFRDAALDTAGIESVDVEAVEADTSYALVRARPAAIPLFREIADAMARAGLVVRKPVVYRDGAVHSHVVGDADALHGALGDAPDGVDVRVESVGQFPCARVRPTDGLSDRQREALAVALALGYYDDPRSATHADVAEELDCAPSTAGEHLRKAESKLVRAGMEQDVSAGIE